MEIIKTIGEFLDSTIRRKNFCTAMLMLGVSCWTALGSQSVSLAWDASPGTSVSGYVVKYGTASGVYTSSLDVGNQLRATIPGLQDSFTYYFAVTARDANGLESTPSNEISYEVPIQFHITAPPLKMTLGTQGADPVQVRFLSSANQTYELQATEDFQTWTTIWYSLPQPASQLLEYADREKTESGKRFYRLVVH